MASNALTQEEENYVRMALLLTGISPRAVRVLFDKAFPPISLSFTVNDKKVKEKLNDLRGRRVINKAQWDLLFPITGITDSKTFDVTLMIALLRNLTTLHLVTPINGYDYLPDTTETTPASDLARIKHYRNLLVHPTDGKVDGTLFTTAWKDISDAVLRLGGNAMKQESDQLMTKPLDMSSQEILRILKQAKVDIEAKRFQKDVIRLESDQIKTKEDVKKQTSIYKDTVPRNRRVVISMLLDEWQKNAGNFVETRAAKCVLKCIKENSCVTITASSGAGKTSTLRHVALKMKEEGYDILPVNNPNDIIQFYNPNQKTLFVIDDFCGTYSINHHYLYNLDQDMERIKLLIKNKFTKIIVACRLQVYHDTHFKLLSIFRTCVCNMQSEDLCLLQKEQVSIAELYLETKASEIIRYCDFFDCFPLLCKLYSENPDINITDFIKNPFSVYETEINKLYESGHSRKYCALALCVMFNNNLKEELFSDEIDKETRTIIEETYEACRLDRGTSRLILLDELYSLEHTFFKKEQGVFKTKHNKLFDFLVYYFGKKIIQCLIRYAHPDVIKQRFFLERKDDMDQFITIVPTKYHHMYMQRMNDDRSIGNIPEVILRMDEDSIQIYMNALKSGSEIKKDIRVIVVGKKGAGKTCLVRKLLKQHLNNVDSTNGIDIHVKRCKIRTTDKKWIFQEENLNSDIHHRILKSLITHTRVHDLSMSVSEIKQEQHECGNEEKYENLESIKLTETTNQSKDTHSVKLEDTQTLTTVPANAKQEMSIGVTDNRYYSDLQAIVHFAKDMDSEEYASVCFWDFAGDKEFYNTHQTFLSKEAIYLVVTKLNETDDETNETFKFWFDSVHFYVAPHDTHEDKEQVKKQAWGNNIETKNSDDNTDSSQTDESDSMSYCMGTTALQNILEPPIIAVGTHKDQSADNFKEALADKIRNYLGDSAARQHLRDCHYVSNTTDKDDIFEDLRTRIYEISKNRSNFGKLLPVRFIKLEKSINEKLQSGKQFLSFDDIKAIAEANETITDVAELDVFLRYQHGFGNMIYYKDIPEYIILNPQWLVNAFRVLVRADKYEGRLIGHKEWDTYANYGKLGDNLLNCIFKSQTKDIKECKEHILKIMEKFDIIVRPKMLINGKEHVESHYYVPCMIKTMTSKDIQKQLKTPHQKSFCLCLEFNFLPPVFINHLIISCIRKFPMSKVGQKKNRKPALFRHTALFDIKPCEKLFVVSCQNVIQIQIWKYDSGNRSPYLDIRNFIQAEVDKIIQERYGLIHIKYEISLKCDRTSYDIVEGTKHLVNMKDDEDFYCEEHEKIHVYKNDWFNEEQTTKKSVQCQTDQENPDCKKERDRSRFETLYLRTKVHTASTASLDHNLEETSSTTVSPIINKEQLVKESFTADEFNFAKMGKIALNILRDALFDLLKLDKHGHTSYTMPDRNHSDITSLYKEHRKLNMHVPSYSSTRPNLWGGKWTDIAITDTGLGDDIERIRLTRNELQHANSFSIDDVRYKELCVILQDLLNRFDQINKPSPLYTKRMNEVLLIEFDRDEIEYIKHKFEHSLKRKTDCKLETDSNTHVEIECQIKYQN